MVACCPWSRTALPRNENQKVKLTAVSVPGPEPEGRSTASSTNWFESYML